MARVELGDCWDWKKRQWPVVLLNLSFPLDGEGAKTFPSLLLVQVGGFPQGWTAGNGAAAIPAAVLLAH